MTMDCAEKLFEFPRVVFRMPARPLRDELTNRQSRPKLIRNAGLEA